VVNFGYLFFEMNTLCAFTTAYCFVIYLLKCRMKAFKNYMLLKEDVHAMTNNEIDQMFKMYKKMYQVIQMINDAYGLKQLFNTLSDFTVITHELFFIFKIFFTTNMSFFDISSLMVCGIWVVVHSIKLLVTCYMTQTTLNEVSWYIFYMSLQTCDLNGFLQCSSILIFNRFSAQYSLISLSVIYI
jgi:hypothetical protein